MAAQIPCETGLEINWFRKLYFLSLIPCQAHGTVNNIFSWENTCRVEVGGFDASVSLRQEIVYHVRE